MLATFPDDEVKQLFKGNWPPLLTSAGTPNVTALIKELAETRERGYSIDDGQVREGMHCFGAPVFDSSGTRAVAGVAVSMLSLDVNAQSQAKAGRAIRRLADRLSQRMGANFAAPVQKKRTA